MLHVRNRPTCHRQGLATRPSQCPDTLIERLSCFTFAIALRVTARDSRRVHPSVRTPYSSGSHASRSQSPYVSPQGTQYVPLHPRTGEASGRGGVGGRPYG